MALENIMLQSPAHRSCACISHGIPFQRFAKFIYGIFNEPNCFKTIVLLVLSVEQMLCHLMAMLRGHLSNHNISGPPSNLRSRQEDWTGRPHAPPTPPYRCPLNQAGQETKQHLALCHNLLDTDLHIVSPWHNLSWWGASSVMLLIGGSSIVLHQSIVGYNQGRVLLGLFRNRNSWNKPDNCSFSGYSHSSGCKTFTVTLLTGSDMSVINSGPKRKNYSDHSSYSYSGIGPKECAPKTFCLWMMPCWLVASKWRSNGYCTV